MPKNYKPVDKRRWPGIFAYESSTHVYMGKPDVTYYIHIKVDGKPTRVKAGKKSEGYSPPIVADMRASMIREARHGGAVMTPKEVREARRKSDRTLNEIAAAYFEIRNKAKWGRLDHNRYAKDVAPLLGDRPVSTFTPRDMDNLRHSMPSLAAASVWGALELVRRLVNYGSRNKLCKPLDFKIAMPRLDNEVVQRLRPEELSRLLEVLDSWPAQDVARMLRLAMVTGMRRGEIFKLEECDLDFDQGHITLRSPKGGKTVSIPLNRYAQGILEQQLAWKRHQHPESPFVFPGKQGGERTDSHSVYRIKEAARLPKDFRIFHGLRHHYAITLANSGECSMSMIQELLTHKDQKMTKRYAQYLPDTKRKFSELGADLVMAGSKQPEVVDDQEVDA